VTGFRPPDGTGRLGPRDWIAAGLCAAAILLAAANRAWWHASILGLGPDKLYSVTLALVLLGLLASRIARARRR
jgi:hypothetical protein